MGLGARSAADTQWPNGSMAGRAAGTGTAGWPNPGEARPGGTAWPGPGRLFICCLMSPSSQACVPFPFRPLSGPSLQIYFSFFHRGRSNRQSTQMSCQRVGPLEGE